MQTCPLLSFIPQRSPSKDLSGGVDLTWDLETWLLLQPSWVPSGRPTVCPGLTSEELSQGGLGRQLSGALLA